MFFPLNCTTSRWIKIGAAFQSASDVAVVQKAGKFTVITMVSKNKRISLQTLQSMCVSSWNIWQDSGVSMEIFLFLVGQILKSGNVHDLGHGGFMRFWHGNQFPTVRFEWRDSQHVVVDCPLFTSNSRILCPVCCILHLALQDLETQVHLWTKHRHTGLTVNFNSNGAATRCLTSPCRDLGSNGQSSCLVFIFVNENETTRI